MLQQRVYGTIEVVGGIGELIPAESIVVGLRHPLQQADRRFALP